MPKVRGVDRDMKIFLAGGVQGNLHPMWRMIAKGKGWEEAVESFLGRDREPTLDSSPDG